MTSTGLIATENLRKKVVQVAKYDPSK